MSNVNAPRLAGALAGSLWVLAATLTGCDDSKTSVAPPQAPQGSAPTIAAQPANIIAGEGTRPTFTVTANSDAGAISYQWMKGNVDISGATGPSYTLAPLPITANGDVYSVRLTNSVGNTTSGSATLSVNERGWASAGSVIGGAIRQAATVVDSNGHTHVIAITGDTVNSAVVAKIKLQSNDATTPNNFTDPGNGNLQASAALTVPGTAVTAVANSAGYVMAVWSRNGLVGAALYTPGSTANVAGSWSLLPTRISSFTTDLAQDPSVAAVGTGAFEFVWRERPSPSAVMDVVARRFTISSNSLSAIESLEASSAAALAPKLVSDSSGDLLAAWTLTGVGTVINRRLASDGAWSNTPTTIDGSQLPLEVLRSNAAGKAVALTSNRLGTVQASRLDLAATNPVLATAGAIANAYGSAPDAFVASTGHIRVFGVSMNSSNGNTQVFEWIFTPNVGWNAPVAVSGINTDDFRTAGLGYYSPIVGGIDAAGNLIVSWTSRVTTADINLLTRRFLAATSSWRAVTVVGGLGGQFAVAPASCVASDGSATIVYSSNSGAALNAVDFRSSNNPPGSSS